VLGTVERFHSLIITGNSEEISKLTEETAEMNIKSSVIAKTFETKIRSIKDRIVAVVYQLELEVEKEDAMLDRYLVKAAFFIPATLYQLVFIFIAFRTWRKHKRKELDKFKNAKGEKGCALGTIKEAPKEREKRLSRVFRYLIFWRNRTERAKKQ
jgi:hypothetical protein